MNFPCEHCSYSSWKLQNMYRHMKTHADKPAPTHPCVKCDRLFSSPVALDEHSRTCEATPRHKRAVTCNDCGKDCKNAMGKHRHSKVCAVKKAKDAAESSLAPVVNSAGATPEVRDFLQTNLTSVIEFIQNNPAPIQMAHSKDHNCLTEMLTAITHFTGPLENRNIGKTRSKDGTMKVIQSGKMIMWKLKKCYGTIMNNNFAIVNSPEVRKFLPVADHEVILPIPLGRTEMDDLKSAIKYVAEAGGDIVSRVMDDIPSWRPIPAREDLVDMVVSALELLDDALVPSDHNEHVLECFKTPSKFVCGRYAFVKHWWQAVPAGSGWQLCAKAPAQVYTDIYTLQSDTCVRLTSMRDELLEAMGPDIWKNAASRTAAFEDKDVKRLNLVKCALSCVCVHGFCSGLVEDIKATSAQQRVAK